MTPSHLVAALFTDSVSVRDAIADLAEAGFGANQTAVALSEEGKRAQTLKSEAAHRHEPPIPQGKHSLAWRFRHGFEHDLHRSGAQQLSEDPGKVTEDRGKAKPEYTEVDLADTLSGWGVAADRIWLLNWEMGAKGSMVLVDTGGGSNKDAGDRSHEVRSILERNCGVICTGMATECSPSAGRPTPGISAAHPQAS